MAGLDGTIRIKGMRRLAELNLPVYVANRHNLPEGPTLCHVLGIFQSVDGDWSGPVAVCELYDGRVIEVATEQVKFLDADKQGVIRE